MSEKPVSRQRAWQLRNRAKGLCEICNRPLKTKTMCGVHRGRFACLWDSLNANSAPWDSDPWVFVIALKRAA